MIERSNAWTKRYPSRVHVLDVPVGISIPFIGQQPAGLVTEQFKLIWDTGATSSVITPGVVDKLGLTPIDRTIVHTPNGSGEKRVYLVNFFLPNNTVIQGVRVIEADLTSQAIDGLIGMDIIGMGDFAVTHANSSTVVTFRIPSCVEADYVKEYQDHMAAKGTNSL